jgi:hypothetical protein
LARLAAQCPDWRDGRLPGIRHVPFEYLARHPDEGKAFNDGQTALTRRVAGAVTETYDFTRFAAIADLKSVIHNWDACATAILMNCRRALLGNNGRVLIIERGMPARVVASPAHIQSTMSDLNMLVLPGGQERMEAEFYALLAASGFRLMGVTPLPGPLPYAVIEGSPV